MRLDLLTIASPDMEIHPNETREASQASASMGYTQPEQGMTWRPNVDQAMRLFHDQRAAARFVDARQGDGDRLALGDATVHRHSGLDVVAHRRDRDLRQHTGLPVCGV